MDRPRRSSSVSRASFIRSRVAVGATLLTCMGLNPGRDIRCLENAGRATSNTWKCLRGMRLQHKKIKINVINPSVEVPIDPAGSLRKIGQHF